MRRSVQRVFGIAPFADLRGAFMRSTVQQTHISMNPGIATCTAARLLHRSTAVAEVGGKAWRNQWIRGLGNASSLIPSSARQLLDRIQKPGNLQRAVSLQLESAWQRHHRKVLVGGLLLLTYSAWRTLRFTAQAFVGISESLATTGIVTLGAALAMALTTWLYRRHFVMSPQAVYRLAMLRLNTHPGVLEVMGAPVVGSDVRASVLTGGGLKFKGLLPKIRSRRVMMIFPLKGTERRGLVSVEAKKRHGQMRMSLLAVDVPLPQALGGEQRFYVEGGPKSYARGGVLDELRRPFLAALTSEDAAEADDEALEASEKRRARIEASLKSTAEEETMEPGGRAESGTGSGSGMSLVERAYLGTREWLGSVRRRGVSAPGSIGEKHQRIENQ